MVKLKVGEVVEFDPKVFTPPWTPYYDRYKGHTFKVVAMYPGRHVAVECLSDPTIITQGYVHDDELLTIV
jgi:hypothetical protein